MLLFASLGGGWWHFSQITITCTNFVASLFAIISGNQKIVGVEYSSVKSEISPKSSERTSAGTRQSEISGNDVILSVLATAEIGVRAIITSIAESITNGFKKDKRCSEQIVLVSSCLAKAHGGDFYGSSLANVGLQTSNFDPNNYVYE